MQRSIVCMTQFPISDSELARLEENARHTRDTHLEAAREAEEDAKAYARLREIRSREMANSMLSEIKSIQPSPRLSDAPNFSSAVRTAAMQFDNEFTIPELIEKLTENKIEVPDNNPNQRVWMVLNQMCKDSQIKVAHKGSGTDPNKYRAVGGVKQ